MDKKAWLGPVKVFCQRGRDVYIFANGNLKKLPSCKVRPFVCDSESNSIIENSSDVKSKTVTIDTKEKVFESQDCDDNDSEERADRAEMEKDAVGSYWMKVEKNECYDDEVTTYVVEVPSSQHIKP